MRSQPFSIPATTTYGIVLDTIESVPWIYMSGVIPYDPLEGVVVDTDIWSTTGTVTQSSNKLHITGPTTPQYDAAGVKHKLARTSGYYIGQINPGASRVFIGVQDAGESGLVMDASVGIELAPGKATPYDNGSAYAPIAFSWVSGNPMVYGIVITSTTVSIRIFTANLDHELIHVTYTFSTPIPTGGWNFVVNVYESDNVVDFWNLANAFREATYTGGYITPMVASEAVQASGLRSTQYRNMLVGVAATATADIDGTSNLLVLPIDQTGETSSDTFTGKLFYPFELSLGGDVISVGPVWADVG